VFVVALFCLLQWLLLPVGVLCGCWIKSLLCTRLVSFVVFCLVAFFGVLLLCFLGVGVAGVAGMEGCVYDDGCWCLLASCVWVGLLGCVVWCTWVIRCGLVVCFKFVLVCCVVLCLFRYATFVWLCGVVVLWLCGVVVVSLLCGVVVTFCVGWWVIWIGCGG